MNNDYQPERMQAQPPTPPAQTPVAPVPSLPPEETPPPVAPPQSRGEGFRAALSTIAILLIAPVVAIILTAFVFQSYQVDGPSMQTTLQNNDRLIVWKLPRTWARLTGHQYVPQRGDVVIFNENNLSAFGQSQSKQLIKRVIALPGEKVEIKDNKLVVYNAQHPSGFVPDDTLPYGSVIGDTEPEQERTSWTLGPKEIFVAGDNRSDSLDSRAFDPVPLDDVIGKLVLRILPLGEAKRF